MGNKYLSNKRGGGSTSPLTTKGDIWGFDTVDDRIPIGANDEVLTADSTQGLGLKWAAAAGGSGSVSLVEAYKAASAELTKTFTISPALDWDNIAAVLIYFGLKDNAEGNMTIDLTLNGVTGTAYDKQSLKNNSGVVAGVQTANAANWDLCEGFPSGQTFGGFAIITRGVDFYSMHNFYANSSDGAVWTAGTMDIIADLSEIKVVSDFNWKIGSYINVLQVSRL